MSFQYVHVGMLVLIWGESNFLEIKYYIEIPKRNNKTKIKYY